jgi:manganese/zinc/iron transport system permease protein
MLKYFTNSILYAPTIASMLMCMSASLVGVLVFIRKRSLLGEALSHAAYPGVILSILISSLLFENVDQLVYIVIFSAFLSSLAGLSFIGFLEKRFRVPSDSALCFVLSLFFGIGILLASFVQRINPQEFKMMQAYLFGQAATMTDIHVYLYAFLLIVVLIVIISFYKEIKAISFDINYATTLKIKVSLVESVTYFLIILATVAGIRSVGVVLVSAMLIAPPAAARQYTNRLSIVMVLSLIFGLISGFFGNVLSFELSLLYQPFKLSFPLGPMIVLVASFIAIVSLLFAPKRGVFIRYFRIVLFRFKCVKENVLKTMWRFHEREFITFNEIQNCQPYKKLYLNFVMKRLEEEGLVSRISKKGFLLTEIGLKKSKRIVRLHRLWEVYLANYLGAPKDRVHKSAEEMEHIITKPLEKELIKLLQDPKLDPHENPIPEEDTALS